MRTDVLDSTLYASRHSDASYRQQRTSDQWLAIVFKHLGLFFRHEYAVLDGIDAAAQAPLGVAYDTPGDIDALMDGLQ